MKIVFLISLISVCLATPQFIYLDNLEDNDFNTIITKKNFGEFKDYFNKKYTDNNEELFRYSVFKYNFNKINEWNNNHSSFNLSLNQFSDLHTHEFASLHNGYKFKYGKKTNDNFKYNINLPDAVNWLDKNVVNPIKNQGKCGSCYAFSSVQALESAWAIKNQYLYNLSEQQIVDCDKLDQGCNGGLMENVYNWIKDNGGITTTANYTYTGHDGLCDFKKNQSVVEVKGYVSVPNNTLAVMTAVVQQPLSVAINANTFTFQFYHSGVYDPYFCKSDESSLDHGVGIVGYGSLNGKDYFLVRNSWGETWGDNGYILMARGDQKNTCGILNDVIYPIV